MSAMGSLSEFRFSARKPLKLPSRYRERASASLMAVYGWFSEGQLSLFCAHVCLAWLTKWRDCLIRSISELAQSNFLFAVPQ